MTSEHELFIRDVGVSQTLDELEEKFRREFKMSDNQIAKSLRERALVLAPRTKVKTIKITPEMVEKALSKKGTYLRRVGDGFR